MLERLDKAFREYLSENVKTYTREELMGQSGSLPMELDQNSIDVYFDQYVERYYQQIEGTELYCAYDLDPEQDFYNEK